MEEVAPQPFLPRVRMIWFFIVVTIVAVALAVVRSADQGRSLQAALAFTLLFATLLATFCAASFMAAFLLGAVEKAIAGRDQIPTSPFSDGSLPEQIIPPKPVDSNQ